MYKGFSTNKTISDKNILKRPKIFECERNSFFKSSLDNTRQSRRIVAPGSIKVESKASKEFKMQFK